MADIVSLIKTIAAGAVETSSPCMLCFGTVKEPFGIAVGDKLLLEREELVELSGTEILKKDDLVLLLSFQGGQQYVVLGKVLKDVTS